ncbi:protein ABHD13 [Bacillus rossius redtenbacheri]|uniref:protein ABHD13 n=1 Tax=Bacillus rossius redtenbacheri TaxID=93214 RepID=UPI002FDCDE07
MECKLRTRSVKIAQVLGNVLMRCWAVTCLASMLCLILYWVYGCLWAIMLLIFVTTGVLYYSEDFLLFHPDMPAHSRVFVPVPSMFGLPYENLYVRSADGTRLHLYFIRQPGPVSARAPTVLFLHGNAGNMGHRLQNVLGLYQQLQCNVLMLEYRGYGLSQGSPSEHGLYADARAALDYLSSRSDINHAEVVVFGRSLGGAVAIDVAAQPEYAQKIWCLVVENTFTSIPDMARVLIGWRLLQYLPRFLYKNKFLSAEKVGRVTAPTLFVSGLADILVPPRMMSELHGLCRAHRQLLQLETGTHNDTWTCPGYYHALANFLRDARARRGAAPAPPPPSPSTRIEHV